MNIDPVRTAQRYSDLPTVRNSCTCAYCQNFRAAVVSDAGHELGALLRELEIPAHKVGDVTEYGEGRANPRAHLYIGWYDLVGEILDGHKDDAESPAKAFSVSFHPWSETRTWAEAPDAPQDSIVLGFSIELPWVLEDLP